MIYSFVIFALLLSQTSSANARDQTELAVQQLSNQGRWSDVIRLAEAVPSPSAEVLYDYGLALAHLGRNDDARATFLKGLRLFPKDKRFPTELAGLEFKRGDYSKTKRLLRYALQLDPKDAYLNNFMGTIYFLEDNVEGALKYWNRIDKPRIEAIHFDPEPRVDTMLLDRAIAFSPASTMKLQELLTTEARLQGLQIFPSYAIRLNAREDDTFDVSFQAQERNGWGANKLQGTVSLLRGVFYQTIYPEFYNLDHSAVNLVSMVRWDSEKRRLMSSLSGPVKNAPKWRYQFGVDLRNENWDIRNSSSAQDDLLGHLNLRRYAVNGSVTSFQNGRFRWSNGFEISRRDYRDVNTGSALSSETLRSGYQLKHVAEVEYGVWRLPERRAQLTAEASTQIGRIWSNQASSFAKLQCSLKAHWFPQAKGKDYEMQEMIRSGTTFGQAPFDELYMLGLERDNDLWMRAHVGTFDGRKGSAPLGTRYFLSNWEVDKILYQNGLLTWKMGPFLDIGKITGSPNSRSGAWLWDTGANVKIAVLGVGVTFTYGKDLRTGKNAFYVTAQK